MPDLTQGQVAGVLAYITAGIPNAKPLGVESVGVYYDLLKDLSLPVLMLAAKRVVLEHKYANFPPVALIREIALATAQGRVQALSSGDAWGIALKACRDCDLDVNGSVERAMANVPDVVRVAINKFGFRSLYSLPNSAVETARAQFMRIFESVAEEERRTGLLPTSLKNELECVGKKLLPGPIQQVVARIGLIHDGGSKK